MKQLKFLETKRTPRYSLRKFSVGVASVLLGVTIFGINLTDHSVKAATTESVKASKPTSNSQVVLRNTGQTNPQEATSATGKVQQNGASNDATGKVQQNGASNDVTEKVQQNGASNDATEKVQQNSASNDATANNPTESATTSQSAPKTQGSAHTDIKSLVAKSAAKLAFMNLMAASDTDTGTGTGTNTGTGTHKNPAGTFSKDGSTITVKVEPAANTRGTATINYVDESGATVKTITATGFVGDRIDAGSYLPDRYTIAEKDQTSASGKLFEDSPATITVYVKPGSNQDLKNSNTKNTPSEDGPELPLSDGTAEGLRKKVEGLTKDQYANNKISITNIQFNKDEVKDYDPALVDPKDPSKNVQAPMDLQVTFDWEGIGLRKGDVLVTPMSDAFDSTVRLPLEKFSSASISDMGIIVLDYDKRKMYVEFRKDLDPSKVYHGSIKLGTFINRNYFTKLNNDKTLNIPKPNGDIVQKHLTVTYQDAPNYDNAYMQAIAQKMSKDETSSDVTWAVEVNPISKNSNDNKIGKNNMAHASIYITPNEINGVYPEYDGSGNVDATRPSYSESDLPVELVGGIDSFKVYEAEISPSMGYKKLKELKRDVDYEVLDSNDPETPLDNYNDHTKQTSHAKNVYVINLKGDYTVTNKKFVVEYTTHHSNLVYDHGNDRGSSKTQVRLYSLVTYTHADDQNQIERTYNRNEGRRTEAFDGDIIGASINVISSTVDATGTTTDLRGSVVVTHVDATTGRVLKADGYAIDADGKEMRNVLVGTHYTTNPEYFDGYKFTSIAYDSDNPDGEVEQGVKHVIYQYVPVAAKGNVDVTYVTEDGKVLKATQLVFQDS
ncbi:YSIRK-type signal peptide-containing protein, partial [Lactobacillus gallinarum]|uniref:YSIRK-type signal peptide-containing protein n=1 Tax=Lactobacillus gallinarum TaxID=52242 RepID=UPI0024BB92AF